MALPTNIRIVDGEPVWIGEGRRDLSRDIYAEFPKWENFDISIVKEHSVSASSAYLNDSKPPSVRTMVLDPLTKEEEFVAYGSMTPEKALEKAREVLDEIHADDFIEPARQVSVWKDDGANPHVLGCPKAMKRVVLELEKLHREEGYRIGKSFESELAKTLNYFAHGKFIVEECNRVRE